MPEKSSEHQVIRVGFSLIAALASTTILTKSSDKLSETNLNAISDAKVFRASTNVTNLQILYPLDAFRQNVPVDASTATYNIETILPTPDTTTTTTSTTIADHTPTQTASRSERRAVISEPTTQPPAPTETDSGNRSNSLGYFVVTCYALGGTTASGDPVGPNTIAADTSLLPFGTHLSMDGYDGYVKDTGGDIKGKRLDIWKPTEGECLQWGRQTLEIFNANASQ